MSPADPEVPVPSSPEDAEAALAAWVAAAYAAAEPAPGAAAECAAAVQARADREATAGAPLRVVPMRPWLRHPWWGGAAAAAALLLVVSMREEIRRGARVGLPHPGAPAAEAGARPEAAPPPVAGAPVSASLTRFAVTLPSGTHSVTLVGDFNGWDPMATPMRPEGDSGAWETALPLPPGRHVYAFVVDGHEWRVDPLAPQVPDDGLGPANAVIVDTPR